VLRMDDGHKAQQHLAGLIATARRGPLLGGWVQWSVQTYAEFMAALYALMTVEAITLLKPIIFRIRCRASSDTTPCR
jgi:hypothetical protein